jgi:nitrogenase molybdenum-iron protein alpha/beta subunit
VVNNYGSVTSHRSRQNDYNNMKISRKDAKIIKVDDATTIESLFDGKDFKFDIVIGKLNGHHPALINHISDRAYFKCSQKYTALQKSLGRACSSYFPHNFCL